MKHKLTALFCCFVLTLGFTIGLSFWLSYQNNGAPKGKIVHPITYFKAYSAIIQTDNGAFLLVGGDCQNFRLWIDSCPVIEEVSSDISDDWDYKMIFCDTADIIVDNSVYYIPHTATAHVVYINEEDNIIQFENAVYSLKPPVEGELSFYDCIRVFLIPAE